MLGKFTPAAREVVIRAGVHAAGERQPVISPELLLLALADGLPIAGRPQGLRISPAAIGAEIARLRGLPGWESDADLLASLGIDAGEVRHRALAATGMTLEDPALWTLRRSRLRPLRVTLYGPVAAARLDGGSRKVIEVATGVCRRGQRRLADREELLWGLLSDASSQAFRILRRLDPDWRGLVRDLRSWEQRAQSSPG